MIRKFTAQFIRTYKNFIFDGNHHSESEKIKKKIYF